MTLGVESRSTKTMSADHKTCFVVSDGRRGIENQALGLGEALARKMALQIMPIQVPRTGAIPDPGSIAPDIWIGCGRAAVRAARLHKRAFPKAKFVYVQDPRAGHELFDLIVPPFHDDLKGPNVLPILGSPNRVTPARLKDGVEPFKARIATLAGPRIAVLIGGDSKHHHFTPAVGHYLLERLEDLRDLGASLMITTSRRTPEAFVGLLKTRFMDDSRVWLHEGEGPNPYFAFLASANWIFVTEDSTNMLTEAAATGTPVYRLPLEGKPSKFTRLYEQLEGHGSVRPWLGQLEDWTYSPLRETERVAQRLLEMMGQKPDL
ncbi:mitochondrial fission ELM1 family protein [Woodsholea maritima]|uniref:mitochondrial fission ELM1 family protein n=1 Tax=Woodsholea maritima TaxID=240237 RepID=UPI00037037DB|nr:mitochondrial fission ELM1 family protein [Woodsholea maritima]